MNKVVLLFISVFAVISACGNPKAESRSSSLASQTVVASLAAAPSVSEKLTKAQFVQKVWNYPQSPNEWKYLGSKPAIVDFYADWCGPCKIAGPILDEVGAEYGGKVLVYKINTDQERELAQVFGITGIPAFLYIPVSGKPVMMSGIGRSKEDTKKMFIENIEKYLQVKK